MDTVAKYKMKYKVDKVLLSVQFINKPIPVAARSKAWVYSRLLPGIAGSTPAGGMHVSLLSAVFCQVQVSSSG
jgi:hypothetical protein